VKGLDDILDAVDGAMVARGDLGAELPLEDVPFWQNQIIQGCRKRGKPVIVATNMLESMIVHPAPTRAEVGPCGKRGSNRVQFEGSIALAGVGRSLGDVVSVKINTAWWSCCSCGWWCCWWWRKCRVTASAGNGARNVCCLVLLPVS
jgi:hypothetical protein